MSRYFTNEDYDFNYRVRRSGREVFCWIARVIATISLVRL
jgi:hypothetical protein